MLSSTPNTRPITWAGAARCRSVIAATSTTVLPAPMPARSTTTTTVLLDEADEGDAEAPDEHAHGEREREPPPGGQPGRADAPQDAADPEGRVEVAHAGVADVQHAAARGRP